MKESSAGVVLFVILMPQVSLVKVRSRKGSDDFSPFLVDQSGEFSVVSRFHRLAYDDLFKFWSSVCRIMVV